MPAPGSLPWEQHLHRSLRVCHALFRCCHSRGVWQSRIPQPGLRNCLENTSHPQQLCTQPCQSCRQHKSRQSGLSHPHLTEGLFLQRGTQLELAALVQLPEPCSGDSSVKAAPSSSLCQAGMCCVCSLQAVPSFGTGSTEPKPPWGSSFACIDLF